MTYHQLCRRCGHRAAETDDRYCDVCSEHRSSSDLRPPSVVCVHCGRTFSEKKFDRHRWATFYRTRHAIVPSGRRHR